MGENRDHYLVRNITRKGPGLGLLPPIPRLFAVILITSSFVWIANVNVAAVSFLFGLLLISLNKTKNYPLTLFLLSITVSSYFLGNVLFSPPRPGGSGWWIFTVNGAGVELGIIGGLKRGAMISVSLAWLLCTPIPEIYDSLRFIRPARKWIVLFLRNIQTVRHEFILLRQSFAIRDTSRPWFDVSHRLNQIRLLLQAILLRVFDNIATTTYAAETHHHARSEMRGDVHLRDVTVSYSEGGEPALNRVSLSIEEGEFVYVGGNNMVGKTTLMRVISGFVPSIKGQYTGTVKISGLDIGEMSLSQIASSVRFVPSDPLLSIIGLTVGQDIMMVARDENHARRCLTIMGIEHLWGQESTTLSGGEQARLVLAGILASEVQVVLLDSPLEQLDWEGRREFLIALRDFREQGRRTLIVTDPSFEDLRAFASRFVLLRDGQVVLDCPITDKPEESADLTSLFDFTPPRVSPAPLEDLKGPPVAEMRDVHVIMNGRHILNGIDLAIRPHECVAVVGRNGSGKTTALLTLAGLIKPSAGEVVHPSRVGYVFQNAALQMVEMTARGELALGPTLQRWNIKDANNFVEENLTWAGLKGEEWPSELHPSQIRMLSIAAMSFNVSLIVFDEPTVDLDGTGVKKFAGMVYSLTRRGTAVFIVTHDQRIAPIARRWVLMGTGQIVADGDPADMAALPFSSR